MSAASPSDGVEVSGRTPIVISSRQRLVLLAVGAIVLVAIVVAAPSVVTMLLGGAILALFLRYPLRLLGRLMPRQAAMAVVLLLMAILIAGAVFLLLPPVIAQLDRFARDLPGNAQRADTRLHEAVAGLVDAGLLPADADMVVRDIQEGLLSRASTGASQVVGRALGTARGAFTLVIQVFGVVFIAAYLLLDAGKAKAASVRLSPPRYRDDVVALWEDVGESLSRYLVSLFLVAAVQGTVATTFLWLFDVPYPVLLGTWIAITSTIPYLGTWFGGIPAIAMALLVSPLTAVLTFALFFASTTVIGNVITPRIQGEAVRVHPVLVLLSVVAAGELFGILGVFLAVPALAVGRVLFDFFRARLRVEELARS